MLLAGTAKNTWTPVGNATYNGKFHDLHFVQTGQMLGHIVWPGGFPHDLVINNAKNITLAGRGYG